MIRLETFFYTTTILFGSMFINVQSATTCDCNTGINYCNSIEIVLDALRRAVAQVLSYIPQVMAIAQQYPQSYPAALVAVRSLQTAAKIALENTLGVINTCKSDECCNQCCQSKYGDVNSIYNETAMTVPTINIARAKPMRCSGVVTSQNQTSG